MDSGMPFILFLWMRSGRVIKKSPMPEQPSGGTNQGSRYIEVQKANGGIKVTSAPGGLKLQEHGQDVRYRNVWIIDQS